jgi:hypothetical protein
MRNPLIEQSFTYRQMLTLALVLVIGALLVPTGVNAAASLFRLQDADSNVLAQVDQGKVRVGDGSGNLTIDGNVGITAQQNVVQLGAREPVGLNGSISLPTNTTGASTFAFAVPLGKVLVVETISAQVRLPDGQRAAVSFTVPGEGGDGTKLLLPLAFEAQLGSIDRYAATQAVKVYGAPGAQIIVAVNRSSATGDGDFTWSFSGHLIPA